MTWKRHGRYAEASGCGQYTVCAIRVAGDLFFEAWRTAAHPKGRQQLRTRLPNAAHARTVCEEDAQ